MESKHTKTPWALRDFEVIGPYMSDKFICDCVGHESNYEENKANAAHIVKCVNSHDELVKVLKSLNAALDRYWNSDNKSDGFVKDICKYQSKAELLLDKISLTTPIKQDQNEQDKI